LKGRASLGMSLLELMVVLALISIVAAITLPQIPLLQESFSRIDAKAQLLQDLKRAQAQAITEGCRGVFRFAADSKSYSYGCDYLPYTTANPPSPDTVVFMRKLPSRITIESDQPIIFNSRGQSVDIDYIISTNSIRLRENPSNGVIASGTLLGTGVFSYD
jgi:prepilin-type N-terminal cleavage/methylation domain-containing protein